QLRPPFVYRLRTGNQLVEGNRKMIEGISPISVVWMNVSNCPDLRPRHGCGDRSGGTVRRLNVSDSKDMVRTWHRLVEKKIRAAAHEDGKELQLFGARPQARGVATRSDAGEQVDVL